MDLANIKKLIKLAKEESLTELSYEDKSYKVTIGLGKKEILHTNLPSPVSLNNINDINTDKGHQVEKKKGKVIESPFVGTFYSAPSPGKPTFVKVGDRVKTGDTLCILEAMKIMNEIEAECDGEILEIYQENESVVEFGQPLFRIG